MTTEQWIINQGRKNRQLEVERKAQVQRTSDMEDMQMQLLQAEINNMQGGGVNEQVRQEAQKQASDYLGKWNASLNKAEGLYSTAISEVTKAGSLIDRAYGDLDDLDEISAEVEGEWTSFKEQFGGIQDDLLRSGGQSLLDRNKLQRQFMDLAKPDYEGVSGRAMTDVAGQAEQGRQAEARRLQDLGIDPTSGKYRTMMNESRTNQSVGGAMAANQARAGEKERITGITAKGMELIDPTKDINAATQIQTLSSNLLAQRSNLATTKAGMKTGLAQSRGNLATTVANIGTSQANIGAQYGNYGAGQQGIAYGNTPNPTAAVTGTSSKQSTLSPGMYQSWLKMQ